MEKVDKEDLFDKFEKWLGIFGGICFIMATLSLAALIITIVAAVSFYGVGFLFDYIRGVDDVFK